VNIGILIPGFSATETDWSIPVYQNLVRELARDHFVRVFPLRYPFTREPYEVFGAEVFPFNGGSDTAGLNRWRMLWNVEQVVKENHQIVPFDVIHAIWADETGYVANRIGRQLDVPSVVSVAGGELVGIREIRYGLQLGMVTSWLVQQALKHATMIVAPSPYSADQVNRFAAYHGMKLGERLRQVALGVDTKMFTLPPRESRSREFVHVGSLTPVKRQDLLLELIAKMPGAHLDMVGVGDLRDYLGDLARELGVAERVTFHGAIPHPQLVTFYQSAQWMLVTSQHEAFCMAAVEAAACGVRIIGTPVGILPEIGAVAAFGHVEAMLAQIVARRHTTRRMNLSQHRQYIEQNYSLDVMTKGLLDVYEAAIKIGR
jgi:glycosyltransferase involved in cell wall biosynthesis